RSGGALPARCVKCNADALQPIKERTLYWHHPAWFALVLVNVILYAIVALVVRKKAKLKLGLCVGHKRRRTIFLWIGWGGFFLSLLTAFAGISVDLGPLALIGLLGILVFIVAGIAGSGIAAPSKITKEEIRLRGCGRPFLDSLESR